MTVLILNTRSGGRSGRVVGGSGNVQWRVLLRRLIFETLRLSRTVSLSCVSKHAPIRNNDDMGIIIIADGSCEESSEFGSCRTGFRRSYTE